MYFFYECSIFHFISIRHLKDPEAVLESILRAKVTVLPGHIQAVFIHNLLKLYAHILHNAISMNDKKKIQTVKFSSVATLTFVPNHRVI